jgi:oxepin-CoA hydrolase/3-oxo-5,6-dehydrosuberyl-CoA semialdehyde dehydrogenase
VGTALLFRLGPHVVLPKSFIAFYGMDGVRFTAPIRIGDTIHCEMTVTALSEKDAKRGVIEAQSAIKNHRGETAIAFSTKIIAGRKPL